ncbi:MAG TPA: DNA polymerase III subunit chi [Sphingomonadaceae bacterium]|nr:DNA polymerase III subunit chi [Sphingomonadaceae bacterium]
MRVDFYQLSRDPAENVLPLIARKALADGERLLVVSSDSAQLDRIDRQLWALPGAFLAHGKSGDRHEELQPVLLSQSCEAANGAKLVAFADGKWRDVGTGFDRAFLLFDEAGLEGARACWRQLGESEDNERRFWKQDAGKWIEGP